MTAGIRSNASGTFGALTFGGMDAITFDATGIKAGSYKAGSIVAADFADGALIENAPVGIGYGPGAGGTVTQATSKSTAVTLNKPCGQITMHNASLASGAQVTFIFNNSMLRVDLGDSLIVIPAETGGSNGSEYNAWVSWGASGNAYVMVKNVSAGPLAHAVKLNFSVIKGAIS